MTPRAPGRQVRKRIFHIANLVLVTLAVYAGVRVFYQFVESRLDRSGYVRTTPSVSAAGETMPERTAPKLDYQVIARRDLFQTSAAEDTPTPEPRVDITKIEQTKLNLKLWGTVAADDQRSGVNRAVIENSRTREQHLYRVGDAVENARIAEIRRNYVVLDVNGRKEKLVIEEKLPGAAERIAGGKELPAPLAAAAVASDNRIRLERAEVESAFNNLTQLMSEVKIRPYFKDGKPAGFVVANIAPDSVVREMGIKSGDIVNSINGREIKTVDDAMAFYEQLKSGETLSIDLVRRGRPETIQYTIEDEATGGR